VAAVIGFRHGMVANPDGVIYARLPGFPLSADGLHEAERLGAMLADARVTAVYASPLERAVQTAEALAAPHGLDVVPDDRLLEWSFWEDPLPTVGDRVLAWAAEAARAHDGIVFGVSHEAPLAAAYVAGRGADFSAFRSVHVPLLGSIRLAPGPPEIVDPLALVRC